MQLSTPWFRLPVGPTAQEWWKQHGRELPRPSEEPSLLIADGYKADEGDASDEKPMVEPGTFEWIKAEKGSTYRASPLIKATNWGTFGTTLIQSTKRRGKNSMRRFLLTRLFGTSNRATTQRLSISFNASDLWSLNRARADKRTPQSCGITEANG